MIYQYEEQKGKNNDWYTNRMFKVQPNVKSNFIRNEVSILIKLPFTKQ